MNTKMKAIGLSRVKLTDAYFKNATDRETDYLLSIDTDRMLAGFRENAGLDMKGAIRYEGWENLLIGGHTFGHYMTALCQAYESATVELSAKEGLLKKLEEITFGLKECQDAIGTGFVFAAPVLDGNIEKQFDNVEELKGEIFTEAWVPWYTMHKIIAGLVSCAELGINLPKDEKVKGVSKIALETVSKLGDWVYKRVSGWDEETHKKIFIIEYGGMNDCMYDVYSLTGKEEHLTAAHAFDEEPLFEKVLDSKSGENVLENIHANTTIPKYVGAMKRYLITGEAIYLEYVKKFWNYVISDHTYITGGNSEWEHFRKDRMLNEKRTNCNCETCNVYNFLKLTKLLFMATGDVIYADKYENAFTNSIMSSQNPETGMTTYFQPMASGYFKTYGKRFDKFWCCTGSGMENFSKLGDSFFYESEDSVIINQYVASEITFEGNSLTINADLCQSDEVTLSFAEDFNKKLLLRVPDWSTKVPEIILNCSALDMAKEGGYAVINGPIKAGCEVRIKLFEGVKAYNLYDGKSTLAFKYGPYVLSACLGNKDMVEGKTGVNVTIPEAAVFEKKYIPSESENVKLLSAEPEEFMKDADKYMVKNAGEDLSFTLSGTDSILRYIPHFKQHKERYAIYLTFSK